MREGVLVTSTRTGSRTLNAQWIGFQPDWMRFLRRVTFKAENDLKIQMEGVCGC